MNITGFCPYETPCGWCTKWDKECDRKIGNSTPQKRPYEDLFKLCYDCARRGPRNMSECKDCDTSNGFKYFTAKEN